ncbi:MAG: hypothetical protein V3V99_12055 [candidate division Zixibacteria bacterium]
MQISNKIVINIEGMIHWMRKNCVTVIAVISLLFAAYNFYTLNFDVNVEVFAGRQAKFGKYFIDGDTTIYYPVVYLSLLYQNSGGKATVITDTKLLVKWRVDGKIKASREFLIEREVDNFLNEPNIMSQFPIKPISILGKSSELRQYAFTHPRNNKIPEFQSKFDIEMRIFTKDEQNWVSQNIYIVKDKRWSWFVGQFDG